MVLQDRARATFEAIIAGAAEVFEEYGYSDASLAQVSAAAGVTKGALYFHFKSKEDLARAVIDEQHRIASAGSEEILAGGRPALETMILMCHGAAAWCAPITGLLRCCRRSRWRGAE